MSRHKPPKQTISEKLSHFPKECTDYYADFSHTPVLVLAKTDTNQVINLKFHLNKDATRQEISVRNSTTTHWECGGFHFPSAGQGPLWSPNQIDPSKVVWNIHMAPEEENPFELMSRAQFILPQFVPLAQGAFVHQATQSKIVHSISMDFAGQRLDQSCTRLKMSVRKNPQLEIEHIRFLDTNPNYSIYYLREKFVDRYF